MDLFYTKAYRIFLRELDQFLESTGRALDSPCGVAESELTELKLRSHNLKGGAGLFGLQDIEKLAIEFEEIFGGTWYKVTAHTDRLRELITELRTRVAEAPEPE